MKPAGAGSSSTVASLGQGDAIIVGRLAGFAPVEADPEAIGDGERRREARRIDLGHDHPDRSMEADAGRSFDARVCGDGPIGQHRPLTLFVEPAGDPPGVVVAGEHATVARPVLRLTRADTDASQPGGGGVTKRRGPDQSETDDGVASHRVVTSHTIRRNLSVFCHRDGLLYWYKRGCERCPHDHRQVPVGSAHLFVRTRVRTARRRAQRRRGAR